MQTNEVQRCWGLLPAFLTVAQDEPLDLVELGPSAGLNLFWDRYRYRYGKLTWGREEAPLELSGDADGGPPANLLLARPAVRHRLGVDRLPVDVTTDHGARLLEAFVWADQPERLDRVRRAVAIARADPPRLLQADYLEILPALLETRDPGALTVVYHSASTTYLREKQLALLAWTLEQAAARGPLAWVSLEYARGSGVGYGDWALDVTTWPGGERRRLARLDGHANALVWTG